MGGEKTYEMMWDCGACGTTALLAMSHTHCPSCGIPQDTQWRYFPADEDRVAVEDHTFVGKDRVCDACGTACSARAQFCPACGIGLEGASEAATRADQVAADGTEFLRDDAEKAQAEHRERRKVQRAAKRAEHVPPPEKGAGKGLILGLFGGGAFLAVLVCLGVFFFWKKEVSLENTGHSWVRTIQIEEMKTVTKSAWQDSVPRKGRVTSCVSEKRSTEQVADGETCSTRRRDNGDGTFSEKQECETRYTSKPVYDEKCTYKIDEWVRTRVIKREGASYQSPPKWPAVQLKKKGSCVGCEREGDRNAVYTLQFKDSQSGERIRCDGSQKTWKAVKPGSMWQGTVRVADGAGLDCDELQPLL